LAVILNGQGRDARPHLNLQASEQALDSNLLTLQIKL